MRLSIFFISIIVSSLVSAQTTPYYLQSFELCEFRTIFISKDLKYVQFITPVKGEVVDAVVGSMVGKNYGRISKIFINEIVVEEVLGNEKDGFYPKSRFIRIGNNGEVKECKY